MHAQKIIGASSNHLSKEGPHATQNLLAQTPQQSSASGHDLQLQQTAPKQGQERALAGRLVQVMGA